MSIELRIHKPEKRVRNIFCRSHLLVKAQWNDHLPIGWLRIWSSINVRWSLAHEIQIKSPLIETVKFTPFAIRTCSYETRKLHGAQTNQLTSFEDVF